MTTIAITVSCPVFDSQRVRHVGRMFDVPLAERASQQFQVELPEDFAQRDWRIGLIVGPSGSGKTTLARRLFGRAWRQRREWPRDRAVIDALAGLGAEQAMRLFTAVGFSSPPSWIKPYHVLSNGEQFRCDLARALAECGASFQLASEAAAQPGADVDLRRTGKLQTCPTTGKLQTCPTAGKLKTCPTVAFDEFTSALDRDAARTVSATVAKALRNGQIAARLVAVTCHHDVTEWLQPDWTIDTAAAAFQWRRLRRPPIRLEVVRCSRAVWPLFARHHYLSGELNRAARCFLALWQDRPVAFCATLTLIGHRDRWRISRLVTLPDFQGLGIGMALAEAVAEIHRAQGHRVNLTAGHPAVLSHCRRSSRWRLVDHKPTGSRSSQRYRDYRGSQGRAVASFEYVSPSTHCRLSLRERSDRPALTHAPFAERKATLRRFQA
jgi:GNAT superfamily N-acetyltransferase